VVSPSLLFLLVAYMQFFVGAEAVPARAAIALISVLVMRTLSNSVYQSLPQGSQRMWLVDCLMTAVILNVLAVCEFGVVQMLLLTEKRQAADMVGLLRSKPVAERLKKIRDEEGLTVLELLDRCRPENGALAGNDPGSKAPSPDVALGQEAAATDSHISSNRTIIALGEEEELKTEKELQTQQPRDCQADPARDRRSAFAVKYGLKESDLLFIKHAEAIFRSVDRGETNSARPAEVRKAVAQFNIYLTTPQTASLMCMFLRDQGKTTPPNEMDVRVTFCEFQFFLMSMDSYPRDSFKYAHSYLDHFMTMPPSKRIDAISRRIFPLLIIITALTFYAIVPFY